MKLEWEVGRYSCYYGRRHKVKFASVYWDGTRSRTDDRTEPYGVRIHLPGIEEKRYTAEDVDDGKHKAELLVRNWFTRMQSDADETAKAGSTTPTERE